MQLKATFFNRNTITVAKDLLGKKLCLNGHQAIITETEGYCGADDPASHAYKITKRSSIMFGPSGHLYVYMIYGMYHCLNIVAHEDNIPGAVLIRGVKVNDFHLDGPGKICRYFNIDKKHNGLNIVENSDIYLSEGLSDIKYQSTARIGINKATDKLWRFVLK